MPEWRGYRINPRPPSKKCRFNKSNATHSVTLRRVRSPSLCTWRSTPCVAPAPPPSRRTTSSSRLPLRVLKFLRAPLFCLLSLFVFIRRRRRGRLSGEVEGGGEAVFAIKTIDDQLTRRSLNAVAHCQHYKSTRPPDGFGRTGTK